MSYGVGDLASYGEGCLVEIVSIDEDGLYTVEVIECEDGAVSGTVTGISEYELGDLSEEESGLYE